jgi:hypothetical protein
MNKIVVGQRIPVGAAVGGLVTFSGELWNMLHPEAQLSIAAVGGISVTLVAIAQIIVVNKFGVTTE